MNLDGTEFLNMAIKCFMKYKKEIELNNSSYMIYKWL